MTAPAAIWTAAGERHSFTVHDCGSGSALGIHEARAQLTRDEAERAARFHFAVDQERWMRSRALLRLVLADHLRTDPGSLRFAAGPQGKPFLPDHPACGFNLSHSGDLAAIAVGTEPVGIDIEHMRDNLPFASLAAHAFLPDEAGAISRHEDPALLFYQLWTAKEAVMKCTGLGMSLVPSLISIRCGDRGPESGRREDTGAGFRLLSHRIGGAMLCVATG